MARGKAMIGFAAAALLPFAAAQAFAGAKTVCTTSSSSTHVMHTGSDGSECLATSDGTGKAKANASGSGSYAETDVLSGGHSSSFATDSAMSEAESESDGRSTAHASNPGSNTYVDADNHGVAKGTATGGSTSEATALGKCVATSKATQGSTADANCEAAGSFVHSTATDGGEAFGSDSSPPTCTPNGGTAKVRSTGGNCG